MLLGCMLLQMGFKDILKAELIYKGMLVKELAAKTGISRHTLDNYLNVRERMPTLDTAVKIAQALGVSVEYLSTGKESLPVGKRMNPELTTLIQSFNLLNDEDQKIVLEFIQILQKHRHKKHHHSMPRN